MAFTLVSTPTILARNAGALYGVTLGNASMTAYTQLAGLNPDALLNTVYSNSVSTASTAAVADVLIANLGITGAAAITVAKDYITSQLDAVDYTVRGAVIDDMVGLFSGLTGDATFGAAATAWNASLANAENYAKQPNSLDIIGDNTPFILSAGLDSIFGNAKDNIFEAHIVNNSNTLQSGDKIDGGDGNDSLQADIGNSQGFAITAETTNVENAAFRAQAVSSDSTDNNTSRTNEVQIDAQRMSGVTQWESNNSRADLLIEDVRILDSQITKDITITMRETDPGHVDYGVYFDQYSLRSSAQSSSVLGLELMDTRTVLANEKDPVTGELLAIKESPYTAVQFHYQINGSQQPKIAQVTSNNIDNAKTWTQLRDAIKAAIDGDSELNQLGLTVRLGDPTVSPDDTAKPDTYWAFDTKTNTKLLGQRIILESSKASLYADQGAGDGWKTASGAQVPIDSGLHTNVRKLDSSNTDLVASKIILDDVGRGSMGGDLVVGGLSVGDTSLSKGVQRFEIEVQDNSKLQTINSTNNTLREVTIKNGATDHHNVTPYAPTTKDKGNLTVTGEVTTTSAVSDSNNFSGGSFIDAALPGTETVNGGDQHNAYGFSDVRLIDATAMTGKLNFTAELTERAIAKYLDLNDTQGNPATDNNYKTEVSPGAINSPTTVGVEYLGGTNDDTMVVDIDPTVAGSRSRLLAGREDFSFKADGGAGNDNITVKIVNSLTNDGLTNDGFTNYGGYQDWYNNQDLNNNVIINGGAGNDTIRTPGAGDAIINGDAGNDVIYTDNTGFQTVQTHGSVNPSNVAGTTTPSVTSNVNGIWAFNTEDQFNIGAVVRDINDLRSDNNDSYNLYKGELTVTFKGIPSAKIAIDSTNYKTSDLQINQAIKNAINNNSTLNKLLIAEDGPANSLVVKSLIDGVMNEANLTVAITAPTSLTAAELSSAAAAYGNGATSDTVLAVMTAAAASTTAFNIAGTADTTGDYVTAMATTGPAVDTNADGIFDTNISITGAASLSSSDNLVTPGSDNDIIVLGTTEGLNPVTGFFDSVVSSNETIKYGASFGNDVVVNFRSAIDPVTLFTTGGNDHFDFTAIGGGHQTFGVANYTTDKSINVELATATITPATIEALYNANNAAAQTHVYVSVSGHNVGSVYTITDPAGATNATATLQGTIDLADTSWFSLGATDFVDSSIANYFRIDGPSPLVAPVTLPTITLASNATAAGVNEGGLITYTATVSTAPAAGLSIPYVLSGTAATDGTDYTSSNAATGTIDIAAGATTGTLTLTTVADAATEGAETVGVALTAVAGYTVNTIASTATINDTSIAGAANNVAVTAAGTSAATAAVDTYTVAAGNYAYTISGGFAAGDKIDFPNDVPASVINNSFTDDLVELQYAFNGQVATITLTGLAAGLDQTLNSVTDFNTVFGAGTIF